MTKFAVVTGASYGLGADISSQLISDGYHVYGISRTIPCDAQLISSKNFTWVRCDISESQMIPTIFAEIGQNIDVLVNNAGVFESNEFNDQGYDIIDKIIDINVKGTMYVTNESLKWMSSNSRIFFINSVSGLCEIENEAIYGASKHALTAFAGVLGKELQKRNISVTSIHPGGIETPMQSSNPNNLPGKFLKPSEISSLISFICKSKNVEYKTIKLFSNTEWHQ